MEPENKPIDKSNIISFLDATGRALFGEHVPSLDTADTIAIKNAVVVHVVPQPNGTMALQLLPIFFREFLAESNNSYTYNFPKNSIALMQSTAFDFKLYAQYETMFRPIDIAPVTLAPESKKVKLFDE